MSEAAPTPAGGGVASSSSTPSPSSSTTTSSASSAPKPSSPAPSSPGQSASAQPEPARPNETPAETAARKYKLKVNGVEREYDEETVIRRAQLAESADQKFQEASKLRKQTEAFIQALRDDPVSVLTNPKLGVDMRKIAEQFLAKEYQREMVSPEQRELEELREFKAQREREAQEAQEHEQMTTREREFAAQQQKYAQEYDRQIGEGLMNSGLPKTPQTLKRVAELMHSALKKGYELDVATAVDMVRESYQNDMMELYGKLDGDKLVGLLGEDLAKKIRMYDLQRLKAKHNPPPSEATLQQQQQAAPRRTEPKAPTTMRTSDWLDQIRKKAGVE